MKQKMLDEVAKAIIEKNGAPISVSNHKEMVSRIKSEAAQAHSEMLEAMALKSKCISTFEVNVIAKYIL